jgi:hypothetical protein
MNAPQEANPVGARPRPLWTRLLLPAALLVVAVCGVVVLSVPRPATPDEAGPESQTNGKPSFFALQRQMDDDRAAPHVADPRQRRTYRGTTWYYRPPTEAEKLAIERHWAAAATDFLEVEFLEWFLACIVEPEPQYTRRGENIFQARVRAKDAHGMTFTYDYQFHLDEQGRVFFVQRIHDPRL